jgi:hypothetical protein
MDFPFSDGSLPQRSLFIETPFIVASEREDIGPSKELMRLEPLSGTRPYSWGSGPSDALIEALF